MPGVKIGRTGLVAVLLIASGCTALPTTPGPVDPSPTRSAELTARRPPSASPTSGPTPSRPIFTTRPTPPPRPSPSPPAAERTGPDDPRWRFFVSDKRRFRSAWFDGTQRIMIGYGCTAAPFYAPDPRCDGNGFHHGIDVALPCRTTLRAGVSGRVISPERPGTPGRAYGSTAFRLRVQFRGERYDVLIGHATRVFVDPGDRVRSGAPIAAAGARGSPDGCHLHFEQRPVGGGVSSAVNPERLLGLRPA